MGSLGFPDSSVGRESACNAGDPSLIPGSGRSTGEGIAPFPSTAPLPHCPCLWLASQTPSSLSLSFSSGGISFLVHTGFWWVSSQTRCPVWSPEQVQTGTSTLSHITWDLPSGERVWQQQLLSHHRAWCPQIMGKADHTHTGNGKMVTRSYIILYGLQKIPSWALSHLI